MKQISYLLLILCLTNSSAHAQGGIPEQSVVSKSAIKLYGFVRNYFYYNSRECIETSSGLIQHMPKEQNRNILGEDLNADPSSRMLAMTARVGILTNGVLLGAKTSGNIEGDFNGYSTNNHMFRLRHAFVNLDWGQHTLIMGQTWHPMVICAQSDIFNYGIGGPFAPLNRSPQFQYNFYTRKDHSGLNLKVASLWQLQYTSAGPDGTSAKYQANAIIPELYAGINWQHGAFSVGAGLEFISLRPRTENDWNFTDDQGNQQTIKRRVDDRINSFSEMFYITYKQNRWSVKAKSILGQNLAHLNMMSGYGVSKINDDASQEYTPLTSTTSFLNITYGKGFRIGTFIGFMKNLGTPRTLENIGTTETPSFCTYYRGKDAAIAGHDLDRLGRISTYAIYNIHNFTFGAEYEVTQAWYGTMHKNGTVHDSRSVYNHRICTMIKYDF